MEMDPFQLFGKDLISGAENPKASYYYANLWLQSQNFGEIESIAQKQNATEDPANFQIPL